MSTVLKINGITKIYGKQTVLNGITLELEKGKIYGLIGSNGAGKTTLIKILCGLVKANQGEFKFTPEKMQIGALIEKPGLFNDMTAYDNLKAKALAIGYKCDKQELYDLLDLVGLGDVGKKSVGKFSLGMKQRLGIAQAMLNKPKLLILDEPTNGLDPDGIKDIRNLLVMLAEREKMTIIISSHNLAELEQICNQIAVLRSGQLLSFRNMEDISCNYFKNFN